jgi:hypothetical protein
MNVNLWLTLGPRSITSTIIGARMGREDHADRTADDATGNPDGRVDGHTASRLAVGPSH